MNPAQTHQTRLFGVGRGSAQAAWGHIMSPPCSRIRVAASGSGTTRGLVCATSFLSVSKGQLLAQAFLELQGGWRSSSGREGTVLGRGRENRGTQRVFVTRLLCAAGADELWCMGQRPAWGRRGEIPVPEGAAPSGWAVEPGGDGTGGNLSWQGIGRQPHSAALSGQALPADEHCVRPCQMSALSRALVEAGTQGGSVEGGHLVWDITRFALAKEDRKQSVLTGTWPAPVHCGPQPRCFFSFLCILEANAGQDLEKMGSVL